MVLVSHVSGSVHSPRHTRTRRGAASMPADRITRALDHREWSAPAAISAYQVIMMPRLAAAPLRS